MNFSQCTCVITGASGGIGRAIAHALSDEGARLILVGRTKQSLEQLSIELGPQHRPLVADIAQPKGRAAVIANIIQDVSVNMIIHCAGTSSFCEFTDQSPQDISGLLLTNLMAPMLITQAVLPTLLMRERVTLVNVGSVFGAIGYPCYSSYCASKFGLRGFSEALARELEGSSVELKYFAPRATTTPFNSDVVTEMNRDLGNTMDGPDTVAQAFLAMLKKNKRRQVVGWPEKLFCRINGLLPEIVDRALFKKQSTVKHYAQQHHQPRVSS